MRNDILKKPLHLSLQLSDSEDNGSPKNKISPEIPHREKEKPKNWYPVREEIIHSLSACQTTQEDRPEPRQ